LIQSCGSLWKEYTHHPFVEQMAQGTLPLEAFKFYIKQDYHFLIHYARANGLGAYKSKTLEEADAFAKTVSHIHHESKLHVDYCESFGISRDELFETVEAMETVAYTRYVIDKGHSGDVLDLQIAIAPCMIGYGEIGLRLFNDPKTKRQGNPYWKWICNYADVDFQAAVENHRKLLEDAAVKVQPSSHRLKELCKIFREGTMLEISFWQMGLNRVE
jgi:hydroxymethylpyrimidine/phosphomethylpyrimidine kinase